MFRNVMTSFFRDFHKIITRGVARFFQFRVENKRQEEYAINQRNMHNEQKTIRQLMSIKPVRQSNLS